jgi:uncharacterized protein (DUF433 family)
MSLSLASDLQAEARRLAECVEKDPARLGGEPVFRGTRVPVKSLFDHLSAGDSLETSLDDFPGVTRDQALTVLELAQPLILQLVGIEAPGRVVQVKGLEPRP